MKPRFNPKFTIATTYPMMFSSADLSYIELDMLNAILTEEDVRPAKLLDPPGIGYVDTSVTLDGFYSSLGDSEFERLQLSKQLGNIWEIEPTNFSKKDLKSHKRT